MRYPALIFDFDGTLADTLSAAVSVYNELAEYYSLRKIAREEVSSLQDLEIKEVLKHLGISKLRVPALLARGRKALRSDITTFSLLEGFNDVIPILEEHSSCLGILTSNSSENVEAFLEAKGIREAFSFISTTSKLSGKHKHLRAIAKTFSLDRSKMLYIGDETRDVRAAQRAGIHVAAASWGFNSPKALEKQNPTYNLLTPSDLLDVCEINA